MALAWVVGLAGLGLVMAQRAQAPGERWDEDEVVSLKGTVTEVDRPFATFRADGKSYTVHLGPLWYWEREGYSLASGDKVAITGEISREGKTLHLYPHRMVRNGETYRFADSDGVPAWSRGGRGASRGGPGWGARRGGPGWGPGRGGSWCRRWGGDGPRCSDCGDCPRCSGRRGCPRGR